MEPIIKGMSGASRILNLCVRCAPRHTKTITNTVAFATLSKPKPISKSHFNSHPFSKRTFSSTANTIQVDRSIGIGDDAELADEDITSSGQYADTIVESADSSMLNDQLHRLALENRIIEVERLFWDMYTNKSDIVNTRTINIALNTFGHDKNFDMVHRVMDAMKQKGINPSFETFHILLEHYGRAAKFNEMEQCLGELAKNGFRPTSWTLALFAHSYALHNRKERFEESLEALQKFNMISIEANVLSLQRVLISLYLMKDADKALMFFENHLDLANVRMCNTLRKIAATTNRPDLEAYVLNFMRERNINSEEGSLATILHGYLLKKEYEMVYMTFFERSKALVFDRHAFNVVLWAACKSGDVDRMATLYKAYRSPRLVDYMPIIECLGIKGVPEALEVVQTMIRRGVSLDSRIFRSLINVFEAHNDVDNQLKYLEMMRQRKIEIDYFTKTVVLQTAIKARSIDFAVSLVELWLETKSYKLNATNYIIVIEAALEQKRLDLIKRIWETLDRRPGSYVQQATRIIPKLLESERMQQRVQNSPELEGIVHYFKKNDDISNGTLHGEKLENFKKVLRDFFAAVI